MLRTIMILLGSVVFLAGCGTTPQTAEEFRQGIKSHSGNPYTYHEAYRVNRPYREVAGTLEEQAEKCLAAKLVEKSCPQGAPEEDCRVDMETIYTPTVRRNPEGMEVHLQMKFSQSAIHMGGAPPEGGKFVAVVDAAPAGEGQTAVEVYSTPARVSKETIPSAVRHWVEGTNMGCPDFAGD